MSSLLQSALLKEAQKCASSMISMPTVPTNISDVISTIPIPTPIRPSSPSLTTNTEISDENDK